MLQKHVINGVQSKDATQKYEVHTRGKKPQGSQLRHCQARSVLSFQHFKGNYQLELASKLLWLGILIPSL